jgi:hypothetical protein
MPHLWGATRAYYISMVRTKLVESSDFKIREKRCVSASRFLFRLNVNFLHDGDGTFTSPRGRQKNSS